MSVSSFGRLSGGFRLGFDWNQVEGYSAIPSKFAPGSDILIRFESSDITFTESLP